MKIGLKEKDDKDAATFFVCDGFAARRWNRPQALTNPARCELGAAYLETWLQTLGAIVPLELG